MFFNIYCFCFQFIDIIIAMLQGKKWTKVEVDIGARVDFQLVLKGESGGPVLGFLAVDDIQYVDCDHG